MGRAYFDHQIVVELDDLIFANDVETYFARFGKVSSVKSEIFFSG